MQTRWIENKGKYNTDYRLISGKIPVASAGYNLSRSKSDGNENAYVWRLDLPGNERKGVAPTLEHAKGEAEHAFALWCTLAGLVAK